VIRTRATLEAVDHHHDRPSATNLRERVAVSLLREAADLTLQRQVMVDRIAEERAGAARDRALADLALGTWTESALLWLGWRLLPHDTLFGSTP
jgi:hypothetical protein